MTGKASPLFEELRAAVLTYDDPQAMRYTIGGLLDQAVVDYRHEISGDVLVSWFFGRMFRDMAEKSNHWAILDRQTVFHLGSKYSVLLFQHIASLAGMDRIDARPSPFRNCGLCWRYRRGNWSGFRT